jgi:hypothetical protein
MNDFEFEMRLLESDRSRHTAIIRDLKKISKRRPRGKKMTTETECNQQEWIPLCQSDDGSDYSIDSKLVEVQGDIVRVRRALVLGTPEKTAWGVVAASQSLQRVNLKTGTWATEKEVLLGLEAQLLHIDEEIDGEELPSPPGSVNAVGLSFIRTLLRDRKRRKLRLPLRRGTHKIRFNNTNKRTK